MARLLVLAAVGLLFFSSCLAQGQRPNCRQLNIRNETGVAEEAVNGNDLRVCRNTSLQCCTSNYFMNRRMRLQDTELPNGLRMQLFENRDAFSDLRNALEGYLDNDFFRRFIQDFPGVSRVPTPARTGFVAQLTTKFANSFKRANNSENLTALFNDISESLITLLISVLPIQPPSPMQQMCIRTELRATINQTNVLRAIRSIEELQKVSNSLARIGNWYTTTFIPNLGNFRPIDQCVERFLTLNCAACNRNIPGLCRGVCSALTRGCYSPFQQGLNAQLNILWNVTRQIVMRGRDILGDLGSVETSILNVNISNQQAFTSLGAQIVLRCNLTPNLGRRRRQTEDNDDNEMGDERKRFELPDTIMRNSSRLNRTFTYGSDGPAFCRSNPRSACWNGSRIIPQRDDVNFMEDSINAQARNPVLEFDVDALNMQATALGTPVSEFLESSEFTETMPEGVNVPRGEAYTPEPAGAASLTISLSILLLAAVVALFA